MGEIIYINEEDGIKRVNGSGIFYARMLGKFNADTYLGEIETFAAANEWEKAQIAAHTLKGVASNLALTELWNQSLDVETQLKSRGLDTQSLVKLKTCYTETLVEIKKVVAKYA